jgi:hypothetical protein
MINTILILLVIFLKKIHFTNGCWLFFGSFCCLIFIIFFEIAFYADPANENTRIKYSEHFIAYYKQNEGNKRCKWIQKKLHFASLSELEDHIYIVNDYKKTSLIILVNIFMLLFSFGLWNLL